MTDPVEEVARRLVKAALAVYGESSPKTAAHYELNEARYQLETILRQHRYGAPRCANKAYGHLRQTHSNNCCEQPGCKCIEFEGYGAQGQGVGPRCPKCGKTRPCLMRINATKTEYVGLVRCYACGSDIHLNNIEDFAQFFSPVPSPESATKEEK